MAQIAGSHLRTASVVDAHEQDRGFLVSHRGGLSFDQVVRESSRAWTRVARSSRMSATPSGEANAGSATDESSYRRRGTRGRTGQDPTENNCAAHTVTWST